MPANTIQIVCDSCCELPGEWLAERGIMRIPILVHFGDETLQEGVELTAAAFYDRLSREKIMPTTSQITPTRYEEAFRRAAASGKEILYIGLSSGLTSAVHSAAMVAADPEFGGRIQIVDSLSASGGIGLQVMLAAELAERGLSAAEVKAEVEAYRDRLCHLFTLDTVEFARRSGRISNFAAIAAGMLDIKPVLTVDMAGRLIPLDKVRGRKRALQRLFSAMEELGAQTAGRRVGVCYAGSAYEHDAAMLAERLKADFGAAEVVLFPIGPVIGTHVGPGCMAILFEGPRGRVKEG